MDREKELEKIADMLVAVCDDCNECPYGKKYGYRTCTEHQMAERIFGAGYRKADEVRKETLREIDKLAAKCGLDEFRAVHLRKYAKQHGVEVDK